jgi:hypothetical protein
VAAVIVSFTPASPPPVPQRARTERLRALPHFTAIVAWLASAVLHTRGNQVQVLNLDDVEPVLRDRVAEETVRTLAALDPIAESVARKRARTVAAECLASVLAISTDLELQDPEFLQDRANVIADAVLERYRVQLVYGG